MLWRCQVALWRAEPALEPLEEAARSEAGMREPRVVRTERAADRRDEHMAHKVLPAASVDVVVEEEVERRLEEMRVCDRAAQGRGRRLDVCA